MGISFVKAIYSPVMIIFISKYSFAFLTNESSVFVHFSWDPLASPVKPILANVTLGHKDVPSIWLSAVTKYFKPLHPGMTLVLVNSGQLWKEC